MMAASSSQLLLSVGIFISCSPDPGGTGEVVDYHVGDGLEACADTPRFIDDFARGLADQLGLELTGKVDYYWMGGAEFAKAPCTSGAAGCQIGDRIYARNPDLLHEVVHAVTEQGGMNSLPFFTEGVAVAYDPWPGGAAGPRFMFKPSPGEMEADPRKSMISPAGEIAYQQAGSFVSCLLLRHGHEKFVALTRELTADVDYLEISRTFEDVYDVELDSEVEVFIANDYCDEEHADLLIYDCLAPEVDWEGAGWSWQTAMECAADGVAGGVGDPEMVSITQRSVALEVPASGQYELAVRSSGVGAVTTTIGRCFGCPWYPRDILTKGSDTSTVDLAAGRYFVRVTAVSPEMPQVEISLTSNAGK